MLQELKEGEVRDLTVLSSFPFSLFSPSLWLDFMSTVLRELRSVRQKHRKSRRSTIGGEDKKKEREKTYGWGSAPK